ncbi:SusC/RagA family TonB-linked outer membrane protein [Mariniflexile sp. HMF6888]|uniref:SusC/RagA family TonB-linked outer membrane protein n=1 Tax=Mariniflexile sp. HMF6888 TaxID=3373086 RepID=UPI00379F4847
MKTFIFLFCTTVFSLNGESSFSQEKVLIDQDQLVTVDQVFKIIKQQTDYRFIYPRNLFKDAPKVHLEKGEILVSKLLEESLSKENLNFELSDKNTIIIKEKPVLVSPNPLDNTKEQGIPISGTISDSNGQPLPGANIIEKGTTNGTQSDFDGNFSLNVSDKNATLVISYVGFLTQEVAIGNQTNIAITLVENAAALDEVVVIGYGTMKKADVTSSVATVKADDFIKGSVTDAGQLIQGKVAGLTIISSSGDPTGKTQILLRGNSSLMGQNQDPLVLIDGIPGDMKTVSPRDIETIDVLKDGSAAAIYGTRGTNGVILITTKSARGGDGKSTVEYQTFVSTQTIARKLNLSTAADFRNQVTAGFRQNEMPDYGENTDWFKEISQTPLIQSHNLTFRGGNQTTNYLVSLNYDNNEGIFRKSYNETFKGRVDFNHSMFDNKLKFNINLFSSSSEWNGFNSNIYRQSIMQNPTAPVKNPDGTWFQELTKFDYQSPVSDLYESDGKANNQISRYKGSVVYAPIDGLKLSGVFSYGKSTEENGYAETKQHASTLRDNRNGYAVIGGKESIDHLVELSAEYKKSVKDHNFTILGGYSYQDNEYSDYEMRNWDFPTDKFGYNNIGLGQAISSGKYEGLIKNYRKKTNLIGYFGRLSYNYDNRYLLMASIRREEASQLWGTNNPWGTFPAISVGWRVTEESFMQNQTLFNDIKLRAGYGVTGSQPSDLFKAVGILDYGYGYVYSNGNWVKTLVPASNPNPNLKWEEKRETDIGVDFSMLDNRISGSIDYYNRQIHDLLSIFAVPSPPNLYNQTLANVGVMENKGVEVMLNFMAVKTKDMVWNTSVGFSTNSNKLVSLSNDIYQQSTDYLRVGAIFPPIQTFSHLLKVGGPVGDFYGYKVIDIGNDETGDPGNYGQWVYEGADGQPVKYTDFGHSFEDKKVIGNGIPKYHLSWNNSFSYKNWDLSISQRGAFKFQVANLQRMMFENPTYVQYNVLKTAFDPVYGKTQLKSPLEFNSYYIENGDYWKIDNITLGYNFNNKNGNKYFQSARIYASVLNAFIITGYKGIDPEVSLRNPVSTAQAGVVQTPTSGLDPGMDSPYKYPTTRTFTIGLNVTF